MAEHAMNLFAPEARRQGAELVLLPCPDTAVLAGDRAELQLVLLQLVANAVEAMQDTPPAHRRVLVATHRVATGVELQVSDRGHGLGARRPESLFTPYYTTRQGHMGLGLKVARRVVEAHGGRLSARRRAGGGAVFTVTLPRAADTSAKPAAARATSFTAPCVVQP
jgi:signal transduction histidine kinase